VTFSAWVKTLTSNASSGGPILEIKCFNTTGRIIGIRRSLAVATGGAWQQVQLVTLIPINVATMRVTMLNTSQTTYAWFDDISCMFPDEILFRTLIRQPQYRQTLYSGQSRKIIVGAEIYDSTSHPASSLAIRADLLDSGAKVINSASLKTIVNKSWQNLGISIPSSATGNITVRTRLIVRATDAVLNETNSQVVISSSALPQVYFDDNNRCIVNGTPFFPIGIYGNVTSTADLDHLNSCGINVILDTGMLSRSLSEQSDFLDALNSRNMKAIFPLKDCYDPLHGETTVDTWGGWTGVNNVITGLVNANKGNQALLSWYINEERTDDYVDQIQATYSQIASLDPDHPCLQEIEGIDDYTTHVGISDVTGFDCFPVWQRYVDAASAACMPMLGSQTRVAVKSGMYSRPVWMVGEAGKFPQTASSVAPTAQEILCEAYTAIVNGARGVFFNNLPNLKLGGDPQWLALQTAAQNLKAITPIALGKDVPADQKVTCSNTNIDCITRQVGNDVYILAVNTSYYTIPANFNVPEKLASLEGHAVESGIPGSSTQRILMSANVLADSISALGTRVYKLTTSSLDVLLSSPKPNFKAGHTLPRLSYWTKTATPFDISKELAQNWGYAMTVIDLNVDQLANHSSNIYQTCELNKSDPTHYPVFLITKYYADTGEVSAFPETMWCHLDGINGTAATRVLGNAAITRVLSGNITNNGLTVTTTPPINYSLTPYSALPASGYIKIDNEYLLYDSYVNTPSTAVFTINAAGRGVLGSTVVSHSSGATITLSPALMLINALGVGDTTVKVNGNIFGIPASGYIRIDNENLAYSSYSGNTFTISKRGALNTTPSTHATATNAPWNLTLATAITTTNTLQNVVSQWTIDSSIPSTGWIEIDNEKLKYSSYAGKTFTISERGAYSTTAATHTVGTILKVVTTSISDKPVQQYSPIAPDSIYQNMAASWTTDIVTLQSAYPNMKIPVLLNGGEWGISYLSSMYQYWIQDPDVVAKVPCGASKTNATEGAQWFDFLSIAKARQTKIIVDAFRALAPDRDLMLYYPASGHLRYPTYWQWMNDAWDYNYMRNSTDYPSASPYYTASDHWTKALNLLTLVLAERGNEIADGDALSYNFVCGGWRRGSSDDSLVSPTDRYMGFLKCYYTTGMIGACAGYFNTSDDSDPIWLQQFEALGHVHALFSHLEDYLRKGTLLPGPNMHQYTTDQPAYEFPTGDSTLRVLARKLNVSDNWLITAWAAGGATRDATVTIPVLGTVTVSARVAGSVYTASIVGGNPVLTLMDTDALNPSAGL